MVGQVLLANGCSVDHYRRAYQNEDVARIRAMVLARFNERYFDAVGLDAPCEDQGHGFSMMAVACIAIETLQAFYEGLPDTRGRSAEMFRKFFSNDDLVGRLSAFNDADWFYTDIRCGILHQAETRGGWRILRRGELLDRGARTINAAVFLAELRGAVKRYADLLTAGSPRIKNLNTKMEAIIERCHAPAQ